MPYSYRSRNNSQTSPASQDKLDQIWLDFLLNQLGYLHDDFRVGYRGLLMKKKGSNTGLSHVIDKLTKELRQKQESNQFIDRGVSRLARPEQGEWISATEISQYTFCPVSFVIERTGFPKIKLIDPELAPIRSHDWLLLDQMIYKFPTEPKDDIDTPAFLLFKEVFSEFDRSDDDDLRNAEIVFTGHSQKDGNKVFYSEKGTYKGTPDYILKTKNNQYVVIEEKFTRPKDLSKETPDNLSYRNQLLSYMYGIQEYDISHGYLLYWEFNYETDGKPFIHSCKLRKVLKDEKLRTDLNNIFGEIKQLIRGETVPFDVHKRQVNKCANCISRTMCGHKTGRFDQLSYPYSVVYTQTHRTPKPPLLVEADAREEAIAVAKENEIERAKQRKAKAESRPYWETGKSKSGKSKNKTKPPYRSKKK